MTPATQEQIEAACMTRSSDDAVTFLRAQGLSVLRTRCDSTIALLIEDGRRGKLSTTGGFRPAETDLSRSAAKMACDALLRAHLKTGRHWISDPARMADALRQAGMVRA